MRKAAFTVLLILLFAATGFCADKTGYVISGEVTSVGDNQLSISIGPSAVTFEVDQKAVIKSTEAGLITLGDIDEGDSVEVHYNQRGQRLIATIINLTESN